jgi:hypothetical protein
LVCIYSESKWLITHEKQKVATEYRGLASYYVKEEQQKPWGMYCIPFQSSKDTGVTAAISSGTPLSSLSYLFSKILLFELPSKYLPILGVVLFVLL